MTVLERPAAEQALAERIRAATNRLPTGLRSYFTGQAIEQCTLESLEPYRAAPVLEFVPLLIERMARERLMASLQGQTP